MNFKKIVSFIFMSFLASFIFSHTYESNLISNEYIILDASGENIYDDGSEVYFKDSVHYKWSCNQTYCKWSGWKRGIYKHTYLFEGSGENDIYDTYTLTMYVVQKEKWWGDWVYDDSYTKTYDFIKDSDAPLIECNSIEYIAGTSYLIEVSAKDNGSGLNRIEYYINGELKDKIYDSSIQINLKDQGNFIVDIIAYDNVGNINKQTYEISLDQTKPTIVLLGDTKDVWYQSGSITALVEDNEGGSGVDLSSFKWWTNDDYDLSECKKNTLTFGRTLFLNESGKYNVYFSAADKAGNESVVNHLIKLDITDPEFEIKDNSSLKNNLWTDKAEFNLEFSDTHSGINYKSLKYSTDNGKTWTNINNAKNGIYNFKYENEGDYKFLFEIQDNVGNTVTKEVVAKIDNKAPSISITGNTEAQWTSMGRIEANVSDSSSGIAYCRWIDADSGKTITSNTILRFGPTDEINESGEYNVKFIASDNAGNESLSDVYTIKLDTSLPIFEIVDNSSYSELTSWTENINLNLSFDDINSGINKESLKYSLDNGATWNSVDVASNKYNFVFDREGIYNVVFKIDDNAGNTVTSQVYQFMIDNSIPTINFEIDDTTINTDNLILKNIMASDTNNKDLSLGYIIHEQGSSYEGIDPINIDALEKELFEIDISDFESSAYTITLVADDKHGHKKYVSNNYIYDTKKPIINNVEYSSNGKKLNNNEIIQSEDGSVSGFALNIQFDVLDNFELESKSISYVLNNGEKKEISLDKNSINIKDTSLFKSKGLIELSTNDFVNGTNTIQFYVIDKCSNISEIINYSFIFDNTVPVTPTVKSSSHKQATKIEDASNNQSAVFEIKSSSTGKYGIKGYKWELYTCNGDKTGKVLVNGKSDFYETDNYFYLNLNELQDNDSNLFYLLTVKAEGENGVYSEPVSYMFRIDTDPPTKLTLKLYPQIDDSVWYKQTKSNMTWTIPEDDSGVKSYSYYISKEKLDVKNIESVEWNEIENLSDTSKSVNLSKDVNYLYFKTEDYAGNVSIAEAIAKIDIEAPTLSEDFKYNVDSKSLSWGKITDNGSSGLDYLQINVVKFENYEGNIEEIVTKDYAFYLDPNVSSFELVDDIATATFTATLKAFDKAGNSSSKTVSYGNQNLIDKSVTIIPVEYNVNGYTVNADIQKSFADNSSTITSGVLTFPSYLSVKSSNVPLDKINLDLINSVITDETFVCAYSNSGTYSVLIDDTEYICKQIGYSAESGLELLNVKVKQKLINGKDVELEFTSIKFGDYPTYLLNSSYEGEFDSAKNLKSQGYNLYNVNSLTFIENSKILTGDIYFDSTFTINKNIELIDENKAEKKSNIQLVNVSIEKDCPVGTFIDSNYTLSINGNIYSVKKAHISGNNIIFDELWFNTKIGNEEYKYIVAGLTVDNTGKIVSEPKIAVLNSVNELIENDVKISQGEISFTPSDIKFTLDGYLVAEGSYSTSTLSNITINNSGLNFDNAKFGSDLVFNIFGYDAKAKVEDVSINNVDNRIIIKKGSIRIYDVDYVFTDIELNHKDWSKVVNSSGKVYGTITVSKKDYSSEDLIFSDLYVNENNVYGKLTIPVAGEDKYWIFENTAIKSDGSISAKSEKTQNVTFENGFNVSALKSKFDGEKVTIEESKFSVNNSSERYIYANGNKCDTLSLEQFTFTHNLGLTKDALVTNKSYGYAFDGWKVDFEKAFFTKEGIKGKSFVSNDNYKLNVYFNNFLIASDGSIESGVCTGAESNIIVNDYVISLGEGRFTSANNKYVLSTENPYYTLHGKIKYNLPIGKTIINSSGKIVSDLHDCGETGITVKTNDGYTTKVTKVQLTETGIKISGDVSDDKIGLKANANDQELTLESNNKLVGDITSDYITYNYAGWEIKGKDISFNDNGFTVKNNFITFRNQELDLGTLTFDKYKNIVKTVYNDQNTNVEILNHNSRITSSAISKDNISVGVYVRLTGIFSNIDLYYSDVKIYSDGSYFVEKLLEEKTFPVGKLQFTLRNISLNNDVVYASQAGIEIENNPQNVNIDISGLSVGPNGVSIENSSVSPFSIGEMTFGVDNFSIQNNLINFSGFATLPTTLPGALSGMTMVVEEFEFDTDFNITKSSIKALGTYMVNIPKTEWSIRFTDPGVSYTDNEPSILLSNCGLIFPAKFNINTVDVSDVSVNLATGDFHFSKAEATLENVGFNLEGISLSLNKLTIIEEKNEGTDAIEGYSFGLGGSAEFKNPEFPEFLREAKVDNAYIQIDSHFNLTTIDIAVSNLNGSVMKEKCALEIVNGSVSVSNKNENSILQIGVTGGLEFTDVVPMEFADSSIEIEQFIIEPSVPRVKVLKVDVSGLKADLAGLKFENLGVKIDWDGGDNGLVGFKGDAILPSSLPSGLAGSKVQVNTFEIGFDGKIALDAVYGPTEDTIYVFEEAIMLDGVKIGIKYDSETNLPLLDTEAKMTLAPGKFPEGLAGAYADARLKFTPKELIAMNAGAGIPDTTFYGVKTSDLYMGVMLPETVEDIIKFSYAHCDHCIHTEHCTRCTNGKDCEGCTECKECTECTKCKDCTYSFNDTETAVIQKNVIAPKVPIIMFTGNFVLPETLPQGLSGSKIKIKKLMFDVKGNLYALDAYDKLSNITIFDAVELKEPAFALEKGVGNEILVNVNGGASIVASGVPESVKNASLEIDKFELSTVTGVRTFDVSLKNDIAFTVFGGVEVSINKLNITSTGFSTAASAKLTYPGPIVDTQIDLTNFAMGWDGKIEDIQGGLGHTEVSVAGITGSIDKLYFVRDTTASDGFYVSLDKCEIVMPSHIPTIGGKSFAVVNANYRNRKFNGSLEVSSIDIDIVGFKLILDRPALNFTKGQMEFVEVKLDMPSTFKSASVALSDVSISNRGLNFGGGSFRLPGFTIGNGIGFDDIIVAFKFKDGQYSIEGSGGVTIPNAGQMSARIAFTNKSSDYPIGLKYAYFSYEITTPGGGIPIGATGLFMTGIRGSLAFGPELNDIPPHLRYMFSNGGRISLGVTVKDGASAGKLVKMTSDLWIDITNIGFAFSGDLTVFSGSLNLSASAYATLSKYGFSTGMSFQLKCVKGSFELYIFGRDGRVMFSGSAQAYIGLGRGSIYYKTWKIWKWRFEICVPTSDWWFGPLGADFGDFTNGERGFLAYVNAPVVGRVGVFASGSGVKIGGVGSYTIVRPTSNNVRSANVLSARSVSADGTPNYENTYSFTVGSKENKGITVGNENNIMSRSVTRNGASRQSENNEAEDSGLARMVFVCGYAEGDPAFSAISPSGIVYNPGDPEVETTYAENSIVFIVTSPEVGNWKFNVSGLDEGLYTVDILTVDALPKLTIEEPSYENKAASDSMYVSGYINDSSKDVHVYAAETKTSPLFELGILTADINGYYCGELDTESLAEGSYYVIVKSTNDKGDYTDPVYSEGTYKINRSAMELLPPENVRVSEEFVTVTMPAIESKDDKGNLIDSIPDEITMEKTGVMVNWANTNGMRTSGYILKITTSDKDTEPVEINVGNILSYTFTGYEAGEVVNVVVKAYDENGVESPYSDAVAIKIGEAKRKINIPTVKNNRFEVTSNVGDYVDGSLTIDVNSYRQTRSAYDYVWVLTDTIKSDKGIDVDYFDVIYQDGVSLSKEGVEIPLTIAVSDKCPSGTYVIKAHVYNEGNQELRDDFTITVNVSYPTPVIDGVYPDVIDGTVENLVSIFGSGFVNGSRYYFDGMEVSLTNDNSQSNVGQKTLIIPPSTTSGNKIIKVVGPDGSEGQKEVKVNVPDYEIETLVDSVVIEPGDKAIYPIVLSVIDGYKGTPEIIATVEPKGLSVNIPLIEAGAYGDITVFATEEAEPGFNTIEITGSNGKSVNLIVYVIPKDEIIVPEITSINPISVFDGNEVSIYGNGFGKTGKLYLGDKVLKTNTWSNTLITFTVPKGTESGNLKVFNGDEYSNEANLFVHKRGFTLKSGSYDVVLLRDSSKTVNLAVNGYSDKVTLTVSHDFNVPFDVRLSKTTIKPSGSVNLIFTPKEDAANGEWTVVVRGTAGDYESVAEYKVTIGDRPYINDNAVYEGKVSNFYKAVLTTENAIGNVTYTLGSEGVLPAGLKLSSDGVISGTPSKRGKSTFTVNSIDSEGQKSKKEISISITDDIWAMNGKNAGRSRSTTSDIPSTTSKAWTVKNVAEKADLFAADSSIFVVTDNSVATYSMIGRSEMSKNISVQKAFVSGNYLFVLSDGTLFALDTTLGTECWKRENVADVTESDEVILINTSDGKTLVLTVEKGELAEVKEQSIYADSSKVIWVGNKAFEYDCAILKGVYGSEVSFAAESTIKNVSADAEGFVIVDENFIYVTDSALVEKARIEYAVEEEAVTGLDETGVFVLTSGVLSEYDRETLSLKWTTYGVKDFAVANEKTAVVTEDELIVINRYTGCSIWTETGKASGLALYGERLYVVIDNTLVSYNGSANATAPVTTIVYTPAMADGNNGWYKTSPVVAVSSYDNETYVKQTYAKCDGGEWTEYQGDSVAEDGYHVIMGYGIDSKGWRGEISSSSIKVDTVSPVTTYIETSSENENGWYDSAVEVSLAAEDYMSGVDYIVVNGNRYYSSLTFNKEGNYELNWYAVDNAGNEEEHHSKTIKIDLYKPNVISEIESDKGISLVTLKASDSGSGVNHVEYRIDDGNIVEYEKPVIILEEGDHKFDYRVCDNSGKYSDWKTDNVYVRKSDANLKVLSLAGMYSGSNGTKVKVDEVSPFTWGSMLYTFNLSWDAAQSGVSAADYDACYTNFWARNCVQTLPQYVLNGEYIKWKASDLTNHKDKTIEYYLKKDSVMYLYADPEMEVEDSWILLDEHAHVQDGWYSDGWKLYMRRAQKLDCIKINVPGTSALPIIIVKEEPQVKAELVFERFDCWNDVYYKGKRQYRDGVQIHIDVKVTPEQIENDLPVHKMWTIEMDGREIPLQSLWYNIPYVEKATEVTFRYKIESQDGKTECLVEKTITVEPPLADKDLYPWY